MAAADQVVSDVVVNDGLRAADVSVQYSGSLAPGAAITAAVTVAIPVGNVPGLGSVGTLHFTATSTEHIDTYRQASP